jgi:DNA invertase Pin-like site-specific DNA recombinase
MREGDIFVITKLDRLGRSTRDLLNIVNRMDKKGIELKVLDQNIDTGTPTGKLMFTMIGAIAEFENELRKERQADGIAMARSRGVHLGRKSSITQEQILDLRSKRQSGILIRDLMMDFKISKASVYRFLQPTPIPT